MSRSERLSVNRRPIDSDIAIWSRGQGDLIWQVNDLCRFYMDTSFSKQLEFDPEDFEKALAPPFDPRAPFEVG